MNKFEETIDLFRSMDNEFRLQMLLDYAEKLPPLPEKFQSAAELEAHKVHECMTPVSLWVELNDGKIEVNADVPRESPTVRGFVSLLIHLFNGEPPANVLQAPPDLLQKTGLANAIGMRRTQGLTALQQRIRTEVKRLSAAG